MTHGPEHHIEHAEHAAHASHDEFNKRVTVSIAMFVGLAASAVGAVLAMSGQVGLFMGHH